MLMLVLMFLMAISIPLGILLFWVVWMEVDRPGEPWWSNKIEEATPPRMIFIHNGIKHDTDQMEFIMAHKQKHYKDSYYWKTKDGEYFHTWDDGFCKTENWKIEMMLKNYEDTHKKFIIYPKNHKGKIKCHL